PHPPPGLAAAGLPPPTALCRAVAARTARSTTAPTEPALTEVPLEGCHRLCDDALVLGIVGLQPCDDMIGAQQRLGTPAGRLGRQPILLESPPRRGATPLAQTHMPDRTR